MFYVKKIEYNDGHEEELIKARVYERESERAWLRSQELIKILKKLRP